MGKRRHNRMLLGLGALVGLCTAGCQTEQLTAQRAALRNAMAFRRAPATPAVVMLQPRPLGQGVADATPVPAPGGGAPGTGDLSLQRTGHDEVGGAVVASHWRSLQRQPESVEPGSLQLSPPPQASGPELAPAPSPYRPAAPQVARVAPRPEQAAQPEKLPPPRRGGLLSYLGKGESLSFKPTPVSKGAPKAQGPVLTDRATGLVMLDRNAATPARSAPAVHTTKHPGTAGPHGHPGHHGHHHIGPGHQVPHEGHKAPLPPYIIEPPDELILRMPEHNPLDLPDVVGAEHLVRPDGTISLGVYGEVYVACMTIEQARYAIATVLARRIEPKKKPLLDDVPVELHARVYEERKIENLKNELAVDVVAYRSKFFYVIADGGGPGEQVIPIPVTGNDTVLDAIGKVGGLPPQSCKKKIWVARPAGHGHGHQILPVDWKSIAMHGQQSTNYQLIPGDRLYVNSDPRLKALHHLERTLDPVDRTLGSVLLGSSVVNSIRGGGRGGNNTGN